MSTNNRITIKEAAELLGVSEQLLRMGLRNGNFPFGTAIKTSSRYTYYISTTKLLDYIGLRIDEEIRTENNVIAEEHTSYIC